MNATSFLSPAKLNLFLHVLGRRANGYHELQTVFQLLDIADRLTITPTHDGLLQLDSTLNQHVPPEDNLIIKSAQLLRSYAISQQIEGAEQRGCQIFLEKKLPMGGGLGGGSSNSATTLLALNQLWGFDFSIDTLAELGVQLGADVPVFVRGFSAWANGIGEELTPIALPAQTFIVLTPACAISTKDLFGHADLPRDTAPASPAFYLQSIENNSVNTYFKNDCEALACTLFPPVKQALDYLNQLNPNYTAHLTGTGSSVFIGFPPDLYSQNMLNAFLEHAPCAGFISRGVARAIVVDLG